MTTGRQGTLRLAALGLLVVAAALSFATAAWAQPSTGSTAAPPPPPPPPPSAGPSAPPAAAPVRGSVPPPPPPGPRPASALGDAPTGALPGGAFEGLGPSPDVRPRPEEPPPPGWALPGWDRDWRSRASGLGPPLPPPDPFAVRAIRYRHDDRIVSLDARRKAPRRVPQWVDTIERKDLVEWRPLDIGDLARRMPNVMIADGGNPSLQMPVIRGMGRERVKIITDGVWPSSQSLGFHGGTLSLWDPESTDRVEIYHGPGAYLKGIDSPGGMINIVPRRPRRHGRLSADTRFASGFLSSSTKWRGRAEADVGVGRWAALMGVTFTSVGDRETGAGTLEPSTYHQFFADLAADYFLDNRSRIGITAQLARNYDVQSPTSTGSDITDPSFERMFLALTLTSVDVGGVFSGSRMSISLDTFFQEQDQAFTDLPAGIGSEDDSTRFDFHLEGNLHVLDCHETWAELTVAYARLERTEQLLSEGNLCGGAPAQPLQEAWGKLGGLPSTLANAGCGIGTIREYAAEEYLITLLLEDQWHNQCWDVYGGVRLDYYHMEDNRVDETQEKIIPGAAAGVCHHINRRLTGYVNASVGWRRPSLYERTVTTVVDGVPLFGNPDLDPELHANGEIGIKSSFKDRVSVEAAAFGHYSEDFIAPVALVGALGREAELRNAGDVFMYGGELQGAWRPFTTLEGLEVYGSAGITFSSDEELVRDVPLLWRTGARYSVPAPRGYVVRRWFADAQVHGATESRDGPRGGDAYTTVDFLLGIGLDSGNYQGATMNFGVMNVLDANYTPPASVLPAPGIGFFASLGMRF